MGKKMKKIEGQKVKIASPSPPQLSTLGKKNYLKCGGGGGDQNAHYIPLEMSDLYFHDADL